MPDRIAIAFSVAYLCTLLGACGLLLVRRPPHVRLDRERLESFDEYEIALVNGGEALASAIGLLNLDRIGSVELSDSLVRLVAESNRVVVEDLTPERLEELGVSSSVLLLQEPPADAHPVERAVYQAALSVDPRTPDAVIAAAAPAPALAELRDHLAAAGLVWTADQKARLPRQWRWFLPLLATGLGGLVVGVAAKVPLEPICALALALVTTAMVMVAVGVQDEPIGTRRRLVGGLRGKAREAVEGWTAGLRDAMAVAVVGLGGIWDVDRPLALALGATEPPKRSGGGCGGCGGCGGGCGC